jgi:hypothetical protein
MCVTFFKTCQKKGGKSGKAGFFLGGGVVTFFKTCRKKDGKSGKAGFATFATFFWTAWRKCLTATFATFFWTA